MPTPTFGDPHQARVASLESRTTRLEDDITVINTIVAETGEHVRWLRRAVEALLEHHRLSVPTNSQPADNASPAGQGRHEVEP